MKDQDEILKIREVMTQAEVQHRNVAEALYEVGYRLDPYPNGKSKDQFIEIIGNLSASLDKARNFLTIAHAARINETFGITMERHRELKPDCAVCQFLDETSLVKS